MEESIIENVMKGTVNLYINICVCVAVKFPEGFYFAS